MLVDLEIVQFCAIEARLQMSGELSVAWMIDGMIYAQNMQDLKPTVTDVINLGRLVEPNDNAIGFRTCGVQIGHDIKMDWEDIPRQMVNLMEAVRDGAFDPRPVRPGISTTRNSGANEFFKAYEEVHPFRDGNGRTGVILFNWLNGTLDKPVWPNNCFNDPRRTVGFGA